VIFIAVFQKFRIETTKKQPCRGRACLVSVRSNTGTLRASSSKRQSPVGKETSLKVLGLTLFSLGVSDLSIPASKVIWECRE